MKLPNMLLRFPGIAMLTIFTLCLTGCYGARETDDVAYILVVGVDKASGGKSKVSYQIAIPRKTRGSASGENKTDDKTVPWIISSFLTPSPAETRMLLNSTISRYPNVSHIYAYIFSEDMAREGLLPRVSYLVRSREFRETMFIMVVKGSAEEYIKHNKPTLEAQIHKFYEASFLSASEASYFLPVHFHEFYTRLKNSGGSPYAVYTGINPKTGENNPAAPKNPEQTGDPYLPGGVPRTGTENPVDFLGLAVFRGDKMVGVLNNEEARAMAILQGKFSRGYVGVADPLEPQKKVINLNVRCPSKPRITASLAGGVPSFEVEVQIEGEMLGAASGIHYEISGYRELLETQTANLFKEQITAMIRHTQELGTDPVGFGLYLRPSFHNTCEMEQTDLTSLYQTAVIRINVTVKIRRTGLKWRTFPSQMSKGGKKYADLPPWSYAAGHS